MAELWDMAQGRLQEHRRYLIAQAALVWGSLSPGNAGLFVQTGHLELEADDSEVEPYDQATVKAIIASGKTGHRMG